jgi:hypothetical protein
MSLLRISLFLISRLSMKPVATPYYTPERETNRAIVDITTAGLGRRLRIRFMEVLLHIGDARIAQEDTRAADSMR